MTEDHFPPESTELESDTSLYPDYCPHCEQHVMSSHGHDEDCPDWRGNQENADDD